MEEKRRQRKKISDDTEAFLRAGGKIQIIPPLTLEQAIQLIRDLPSKAGQEYRSRVFSEKVNPNKNKSK